MIFILYNKNIITPLLYNLPLKFNVGNCHYITGKDIATFSSILSVENYLTNLTCNCKNQISNKFRLY